MESSHSISFREIAPVVRDIPVEATPTSTYDSKPVRMAGYQPPDVFRHVRLGFRAAGVVLVIAVTVLAHGVYAAAKAPPKAVVGAVR